MDYNSRWSRDMQVTKESKMAGTKTIRKRFDTLEEAIEFAKQSEKEIYVRHS